MASATTTTPSEGPSRALRLRVFFRLERRWAKAGLAALGVLALACFLAFPTYPTYDSLYALLWGRELLHAQLPDLHVYRAPTEHPLALVFGALCSLFGQAGARLMVLASLMSFAALVAGVWRLTRACFGPTVAMIAGLLVLSRFFVENLALQGYLDVTYVALVVWAAALEAERPRRGPPVLALLCAAGLLRPEAWLLSGIYWLWCTRCRPARTRLALLGLALLAPVLWLCADALLTGDPLYSLRSSTGLAEQLGRTQGLTGVLSSTWGYAVRIDKLPVLIGAVAGVLAALRLAPRRALLPLGLLVCLLVAFVAEGVAGASVLDRYMVAAATVMTIFCAVALGGWSLLGRWGVARRVWAGAALALAVYGIADVNSSLTARGLRDTLAYHEELDSGLAVALHNAAVRHSMERCQLVSLPNNKLIPNVRWLLGDSTRIGVVARSQAREQAERGALLLERRLQASSVAVFPQPVTHFFDVVAGVGEGSLATRPQAGFRPIYTSRTYAVYSDC